jgi:hypothetical protein
VLTAAMLWRRASLAAGRCRRQHVPV